jgi:ProP effector
MNKQRLAAALELIGVLAERFPACFAINPSYRRPLKLNIHVDILAQIGDMIAPRDLSSALRIYVSNIKYLKALVIDAGRVDLNGMLAGTVTTEHADIAKAQYKRQREKRKAKQTQAVVAPVVELPIADIAPSGSRRISLADLRAAAKARQAVA